MIRRISRNNDLKDLIKSCPSGVIDDIYKIEYYIQGYNTVIECSFTKVGEQLEVILPTGQLETLPNGILMRRAYYKVVDSSYPDGYYNLEFEDNMNVWIGDVESEPGPVPGEYVTEEELTSTLSSYATQSWVSDQGYLTAETLPSDIATQSWVQSQGYITVGELPSGLATQSWVESQGYLTAVPSEYATQSWVSEQGYLTSTSISAIESMGFVTQSWLSEEGYIKYSNFESYNDYYSVIDVGDSGLFIGAYDNPNYYGLVVTMSGEVGLYEYDIESQRGTFSSLATRSWVQEQGYITVGELPSGLATQSWVESNFVSAEELSGYATQEDLADFVTHGDLEEYATQSWVEAQGYITSTGVSGLATQSWVSSNFLSSGALSSYATQSWVESQGYLTSHQDLTGYATQSWATSQFLEESKIWTGTQSEWNQLTSAQKATYIIALITE